MDSPSSSSSQLRKVDHLQREPASRRLRTGARHRAHTRWLGHGHPDHTERRWPWMESSVCNPLHVGHLNANCCLEGHVCGSTRYISFATCSPPMLSANCFCRASSQAPSSMGVVCRGRRRIFSVRVEERVTGHTGERYQQLRR